MASLIPAAQYLRMSTEHQKYSLSNQRGAIVAYAEANGIELTATYVDAGISGLALNEREGLKQLLADVVGRVADFRVVLVLDVSRWGRFQDPDEAAHYEFICRASGVDVQYVEEPFLNDDSLAGTLMKQIKRVIAAEFSRDLSAKTKRCQRAVALQGYWRGGSAPYGFRRQLIRADGLAGGVMDRGEHKALKDHRSRLVHGPSEEVGVVRRIFVEYTTQRRSMTQIALGLNRDGVPSPAGALWVAASIRNILRNEAYAGTLQINQTSMSLGVKTMNNRANWVRVPRACPAMVSRRQFGWAQARLLERERDKAEAKRRAIEALAAVFAKHGRLSASLIEASPGAPAPAYYSYHFGSLMSAYDLVGYKPSYAHEMAIARCAVAFRVRVRRPVLTDEQMVERLRALYARVGKLSTAIIHNARDLPAFSTYRKRFGSLERLFEMCGYEPTARQLKAMALRRRQRLERGPEQSPMYLDAVFKAPPKPGPRT